MISKLKCPVCQKPLEQVGTSRQYQCGTWGCDASFDMMGTEALWTALIQAKQDLETATKALKHYCTDSDNWSCVIDFTGDYDNAPSEFADKALEQIEHKE